MISLSLSGNVLIFGAAAVVILLTGTRLSSLADRLADRTALGEALTGAIFLGAATSLPGITTSVVAAATNYPQLAMSNALGGIAAQTAFLVVADFFYRRANLEHAAPSVPNLLNGTLLIVLLSGVLATANSPEVAILGIHPMTLALFGCYLFGMRLVRQSHLNPLWKPQQTTFTREDVPTHQHSTESLPALCSKFALFALLLGLAGWAIAQTGIALMRQTGLKESVVGGFFTAIATSTPELVTTVAAVRIGAPTLAIGGILGGNAFDVMFGVAADVAYRPGSVYHQMGPDEHFLCALAILMTSVLIVGMLYREKKGVANVGFESILVLVLYVSGTLVIVLN